MLAHFQCYEEEIGRNGMHIANDCKMKISIQAQSILERMLWVKEENGMEFNMLKQLDMNCSREGIAKNNSKPKILTFYGVFVALSHTQTCMETAH